VRVFRAVRHCVMAACVCAGAVAWAAGPALADQSGAFPGWGSVLHVRASGPLTPNSVLTITATGTNPIKPGAQWWFNVFLVDPALGPCNHSHNTETSLSIANPGYIVHVAGIEEVPAGLPSGGNVTPGGGGPFTITVPYMFKGSPGRLLVCGYTGYGGTLDEVDAAWSFTEVTLRSAAAAKKPAVIKATTLKAAQLS
jgi:hypothetical protein